MKYDVLFRAYGGNQNDTVEADSPQGAAAEVNRTCFAPDCKVLAVSLGGIVVMGDPSGPEIIDETECDE